MSVLNPFLSQLAQADRALAECLLAHGYVFSFGPAWEMVFALPPLTSVYGSLCQGFTLTGKQWHQFVSVDTANLLAQNAPPVEWPFKIYQPVNAVVVRAALAMS